MDEFHLDKSINLRTSRINFLYSALIEWGNQLLWAVPNGSSVQIHTVQVVCPRPTPPLHPILTLALPKTDNPHGQLVLQTCWLQEKLETMHGTKEALLLVLWPHGAQVWAVNQGQGQVTANSVNEALLGPPSQDAEWRGVAVASFGVSQQKINNMPTIALWDQKGEVVLYGVVSSQGLVQIGVSTNEKTPLRLQPFGLGRSRPIRCAWVSGSRLAISCKMEIQVLEFGRDSSGDNICIEAVYSNDNEGKRLSNELISAEKSPCGGILCLTTMEDGRLVALTEGSLGLIDDCIKELPARTGFSRILPGEKFSEAPDLDLRDPAPSDLDLKVEDTLDSDGMINLCGKLGTATDKSHDFMNILENSGDGPQQTSAKQEIIIMELDEGKLKTVSRKEVESESQVPSSHQLQMISCLNKFVIAAGGNRCSAYLLNPFDDLKLINEINFSTSKLIKGLQSYGKSVAYLSCSQVKSPITTISEKEFNVDLAFLNSEGEEANKFFSPKEVVQPQNTSFSMSEEVISLEQKLKHIERQQALETEKITKNLQKIEFIKQQTSYQCEAKQKIIDAVNEADDVTAQKKSQENTKRLASHLEEIDKKVETTQQNDTVGLVQLQSKLQAIDQTFQQQENIIQEIQKFQNVKSIGTKETKGIRQQLQYPLQQTDSVMTLDNLRNSMQESYQERGEMAEGVPKYQSSQGTLPRVAQDKAVSVTPQEMATKEIKHMENVKLQQINEVKDIEQKIKNTRGITKNKAIEDEVKQLTSKFQEMNQPPLNNEKDKLNAEGVQTLSNAMDSKTSEKEINQSATKIQVLSHEMPLSHSIELSQIHDQLSLLQGNLQRMETGICKRLDIMEELLLGQGSRIRMIEKALQDQDNVRKGEK